jgi:hypothetical protein
MYIIATASADTYITNKIIDGSRVEDANVGRAGTLDLFKLYDETLSGSTGNHTELSRLLIKFDISRIAALASSSLDVNSSNFRASLRLKDVQTNLPAPRDFTVSVFPLARNFDEGDGRDVASFTDLGAASYISSSNGTTWAISGAYSSGAIGDVGVDYFSSGNLQDGLGVRSLESKQTFDTGNEDLFVDVTDVVSATIGNVVANHGFILSFTSSQESDTITRFVKRFASRHVIQESLRPRLEIHFNDAVFDSHAGAYFDASGSLYLRNFVGSTLSNVMSASQQLTGSNCMQVILSTGSFSKIVSASQETIGNNRVTGSYKSSFYISAQDSSVVSGSLRLSDHISSSGSLVLSETWKSADSSVTFLSTFLTCSLPTRSAFNAVPRKLNVRTTNCLSKFSQNSSYTLRVFAYDADYEPSATRVPKPTRSQLPETYYSVRDLDGATYIPFERVHGGTRLSTDEGGLFFNLYTDGLPRGKLLTIDYLVIDRGSEYIVNDKNARFVVE